MALAVVALLAWAVWACMAVAEHPLAVTIGAFVLSVCCFSLWRWVRQWQAFSLRWDAQRWFLGPVATRGQEPLAGRLEVCLDFGDWLLLRFRPDGERRWNIGSGDTWLALQRRGHELPWHALRSTVYCARPVSLASTAPF